MGREDTPKVLVASAPQDQAALDALIAGIAAAWPGDRMPPIAKSRLDELHVRVRTSPPDSIACVVALAPRGIHANAVDQLNDTLHERCIPGVVLIDDHAMWRSMQRDGVLFEPRTLDPRIVAGMVYALCERQGAVAVLGKEITLAQRCQAGFRVEMERLHDELHLAAAIQREYTNAPIPKVAGLDVGVVFRPMSFVSGDIYAVERIGEHHAGILVADVVGHGVPAALLTMVLRNSLVTAHAGNAISPREVLARLNDRMCASQAAGGGGGGSSGRFATAVYAVLDTRSRRLRVAGAGHPSPVLLGNNRRALLETCGPLLGVFEESVFDEVEVELGVGDTLLLYSDGLDLALEHLARHSGVRHPIDAVASLIERARVDDSTSAASLAREIGALIDEQCGSLHQEDDVTVLAVRGIDEPVPAHSPLTAAITATTHSLPASPPDITPDALDTLASTRTPDAA